MMHSVGVAYIFHVIPGGTGFHSSRYCSCLPNLFSCLFILYLFFLKGTGFSGLCYVPIM